MMQLLKIALAAMLLAVAAAGRPAAAEVVDVEITSRAPYADGRPFGDVGPYEQLRGTVRLAVDPRHEANRQVIDLELAPTNARGLVEFSADFEILAPADADKSNAALLYEVNNRGNRTCLGQFNGGADDFLMRQGFTIVWSGWIAEVLPGDNRLRLSAPVAGSPDEPIRGPVRAEMAPDAPAERLNIAHWANQGSYPPSPAGLDMATLTWRLREKDPRVLIPRGQWNLVQTAVEADGQRSQLPRIDLVLAGGFEPGYIYELVYEAEGPIVQGLGLAGIRDLVSWLKYEQVGNDLLRTAGGKLAIRYAYGFGTSQSGRCLRMFLYDGFNADEQGRQVFDGVMPHVAGGGLGFFNHRFASPTRHNGQHDNHLYPADMFPFAYGDQIDPFTGRTDGILRRARASGTVPKVMHTQSSSEYWHRAGSLVHTDPLGEHDAELPPEVRVYTFGGTQHGPGSGVAGPRGNGQLPANPSDYRPLIRALLLALDAWVRDGREPPASRYPRLSDDTLRSWQQDQSGWLALPAVRYPEVIQQPEFLDRGPEFERYRRATIEPPLNRGQYIVKVPGYGADNNELGTLLLPSIAVPVATYTSWNLRHRSIGAEQELLGLSGGYIPLARTAGERQAQGDPRAALAQRYRDFEDYRRQFMAAAERLAAERFLLAEELPRFEAAAERLRPLFEP
ncbi:MAG: alpha/beta hydrolase domain-containing protein [Pirellulales bacterium]